MLMFTCLAIIVLTSTCAFGQTPTLPPEFGPHLWTVAVRVIDEDSNPVPGADVAVSYDIPAKPNSGGQTYGEIKGITDTNGMFNASHTDSSWGLGITVNKSGYYTTHGGHQFYFDEKRRNPSFTLILKKISKVIPMYAKNVNLGMPVFNKPAGYDLMVGDWVAPYGKGINSDIIFTGYLNKDMEGNVDYKLVVSFSNQGDGIQGFSVPLLLQNAVTGQSDLRSSSEAPLNGYQSEWIQVRNRKPHQAEAGNFDPNRIFYFRIRTVLDNQGNVVSTHYGKIYGDFMQFRYYLNPTPNDRSVEFDPKQNLLGGLNALEKVAAP